MSLSVKKCLVEGLGQNHKKVGENCEKLHSFRTHCLNNLSIYRPCSLPGKMVPYPIVTSKPHWKSCQIKWQTSKTIIWLHRAGEQSGTGTLLSQLLFCSLPFVHFCASKIQTADELLLLAVKNCIKNQSEKLTIT